MDERKEPLYMRQTGDLRIRMTNDYLFKAVLQRNLPVLKSLICALLHMPEEEVRSLLVTNPLIQGKKAGDKDIVLDVNVVLNNGLRVNLEMQTVNEKNWQNRSAYYACQNFSRMLKGEEYNDIKPLYQIGFVGFTIFKEYPAFYSKYRLMEIEKHYVYNDRVTIGIVDLTKIGLATEQDREYRIDQWARLFKAKTWEEIKMLAETNVRIADAAETIYEVSSDESVFEQCRAREDYNKRQAAISRRMAKQERQLAEKDKKIADQGKTIEDQNKKLAEDAAEIASLKAQLAAALEKNNR